jgi:hypothetical protein
MKVPFLTKSKRLSDHEIQTAMSELRALRLAVAAAEEKNRPVSSNNNIDPSSNNVYLFRPRKVKQF